jgi:hypothetical protein
MPPHNMRARWWASFVQNKFQLALLVPARGYGRQPVSGTVDAAFEAVKKLVVRQFDHRPTLGRPRAAFVR